MKSLFSIKKITHKHVSWLCLYDSSTTFTKKTHIRSLSKLRNVKIGEYSRIGFMCSIENSTIGRFTAIGKNCNINLGQHPTNYLTYHSIFYRKGNWGFHDDWVGNIEFETKQPVIIENDVWIGINCIVMGGITIGNGAIVAAGSVVTKDVPPYSIVTGVPAKVIKYRFSEDIIKRLLEIKWWHLTDNEITNLLPIFHTKNITLDKLNIFFPNK